MRVVFLNDVEGVARAGDIKTVADGYARNFLLPRRLAAAATTATVQQAESRARRRASVRPIPRPAPRRGHHLTARSPST